MLIVDAVQSSRHLTQRKSDALVRSIKRLAPKRERDLLDRHLSVSGRIKIQGDSLLYNVDRILEAIAGKRKVSFRYFSYNSAKEKVMRRSGERYVETPVEIIVNQGVYYLVTYNPETDNFEGFRVGRMDYVEVSEERAAKVPRQCGRWCGWRRVRRRDAYRRWPRHERRCRPLRTRRCLHRPW